MTCFTNSLFKVYNNLSLRETGPEVYNTRMHLILFVFVPMVEEKVPKTKVQSEQLSDSDTPDEEADP